MVDFLIDHLDPLGQGVSKRTNNKKQSIITFIPKTLPGEQGTTRIIKTSKGVEFGELVALTKISPQRAQPECPHYARCSGCDYQHVPYEDELNYKVAALKFLLRTIDLGSKQIELIPASERFFYRNRVQLHYRHKYLGFIDTNADQVLEVPECRLVSPAIKEIIDKFYLDKNWAIEHSGRGHVEIYEKEEGICIEWNQPYANGGFSQVNSDMNIKLKNWLKNRFLGMKYSHILDLFSGDGNLSDSLLFSEDIVRYTVDFHPNKKGPQKTPFFFKQDLFSKNALDQFLKNSKLNKIDLLLLDPPRKGFSSLLEWDKKLNPEYIVYVSCNPATLARDLKLLMSVNKRLEIENVVLADMFPATRHFETLVVLKR